MRPEYPARRNRNDKTICQPVGTESPLDRHEGRRGGYCKNVRSRRAWHGNRSLDRHEGRRGGYCKKVRSRRSWHGNRSLGAKDGVKNNGKIPASTKPCGGAKTPAARKPLRRRENPCGGQWHDNSTARLVRRSTENIGTAAAAKVRGAALSSKAPDIPFKTAVAKSSRTLPRRQAQSRSSKSKAPSSATPATPRQFQKNGKESVWLASNKQDIPPSSSTRTS